MRSTRISVTVVGLLLVAAVAMVIWQQQRLSALRRDNESLRRQLAEAGLRTSKPVGKSISSGAEAPAPEPSRTTSDKPPPDRKKVSLRDRLPLRVTVAQLASFLAANHRNAESLLAAFRTTGDPALLLEAMERFPDDAGVAFEAAFRLDATPQERRVWLERLKQAAPDNPLGMYLSALEHFKAGAADEAMRDLVAAADRPRFSDFTRERILADEEAFRAAGVSVEDARVAAAWGELLPQLHPLRTLAGNTIDLANNYRRNGDEASARSALETAFVLGSQLEESSRASVPLVTRFAGLAIEKLALDAMPADSVYDGSTVQDLRDQLAVRRNDISNLAREFSAVQGQLSEADWLDYTGRAVAFGEEDAMRWWLNKHHGP